MTDNLTIIDASWSEYRDVLMRIRRRVFIDEQRVPEDDEWDAADGVCEHFLLLSEKRDAVGTVRLERSGKISRLAVLKEFRGAGCGALLLEYAVAKARARRCKQIWLNAQLGAKSFYEQHGFRQTGKQFTEAGIEHIRMQL